MTTTPTFSRDTLIAVRDAFLTPVNFPELQKVRQPDLTSEVMGFVAQDGFSAVVVRLFPSGMHDVLVIGEPSVDARQDATDACARFAQIFTGTKQKAYGAIAAGHDVWRN